MTSLGPSRDDDDDEAENVRYKLDVEAIDLIDDLEDVDRAECVDVSDETEAASSSKSLSSPRGVFATPTDDDDDDGVLALLRRMMGNPFFSSKPLTTPTAPFTAPFAASTVRVNSTCTPTASFNSVLAVVK